MKEVLVKKINDFLSTLKWSNEIFLCNFYFDGTMPFFFCKKKTEEKSWEILFFFFVTF